jgi:AcrR family transcriptional regulator
MSSFKTMARRPYSPRLPVEERREQILDAALGVIERDGYRGVSIDAVAREAGVTRPVVYRVFDDLPTLLGELLDRQERRALAQLGEVDLTPGGLRALIDTVRREPGTWRPILYADHSPGPVRERVIRDRALVTERLAALIEDLVPKGADPDVIAGGLIAAAEHFGRRVLDDPGYDVEPLLATAAALMPGR